LRVGLDDAGFIDLSYHGQHPMREAICDLFIYLMYRLMVRKYLWSGDRGLIDRHWRILMVSQITDTGVRSHIPGR
jgi:hypothetical protein